MRAAARSRSSTKLPLWLEPCRPTFIGGSRPPCRAGRKWFRPGTWSDVGNTEHGPTGTREAWPMSSPFDSRTPSGQRHSSADSHLPPFNSSSPLQSHGIQKPRRTACRITDRLTAATAASRPDPRCVMSPGKPPTLPLRAVARVSELIQAHRLCSARRRDFEASPVRQGSSRWLDPHDGQAQDERV